MTDPQPRRFYYGWTICGVAVATYFFTNGLTLMVPQNLFPRLMETFDATAGEISLTTAISLGLAALMAPFVGALVDRVGVVRVIRTGLVIMALCFSCYPFARSLTDLYLIHAGLALGLVLAGLLVNVVLLSNWFVRKRGLAVGLLAAASSLAGASLPLIISPLVNNPEYGWRYGYGVLAVAFWLFAVVPGFVLLKEKPADLDLFPDGDTKPPAGIAGDSSDGVSFARALRSPALYCLGLGSACLWFAIQAMNSQATIFFEQEGGLAPARATLLFAVIFWLSFAGKFAFGLLSDRLPKRRVMLLSAITLLIGCLLLFEPGGERGVQLTTSLPRLSLFAVVFGLGFGGSFTMIQLVAVETFGQRSLGKILGVITLIDALGAAGGTILTGQLKTSTGGYLLPFAVVTGVALLAVINVFFIRPVKPETEMAAAQG